MDDRVERELVAGREDRHALRRRASMLGVEPVLASPRPRAQSTVMEFD